MKNLARIPMIPNFIVYNGVARHISEFDEEALRTIGSWWIENLVQKSNGAKKLVKEVDL